MIRGSTVGALIIAALSLGPRSSAAVERATSARERLAIASVSMGRTPSRQEIDAAMEGVDAPTLSLDELADALGVADGGTSREIAALEADHAAMLELFFAGETDAAADACERLSAAVESRPALLARRPELRRAAFEARLYRALVARSEGDEASASRWIAAASAFEELSPADADFPPWVREQLSKTRALLPGPKKGTLELEGAEECELWVDGVRVGSGSGKYPVKLGRHAVSTRCRGLMGVLREVEIGEGTTRLAPLSFSSVSLVREGGSVLLAPRERATAEEVAVSLARLAQEVGAARSLAVIGTPDGVVLLLADPRGVLRGERAVAGDLEAIARAGQRLRSGGSTLAAAREPRVRKPWYRDGVAFGFVATGIAAWGTGFALGRVHGSPSAEESAAWALMAGGAALTATGGILFFIPSFAPASDAARSDAPTVGFSLGGRF